MLHAGVTTTANRGLQINQKTPFSRVRVRAPTEILHFLLSHLHRIGSKYLETSNLSVFLVNVKRILLEKGKSRAEMGDFGAE